MRARADAGAQRSSELGAELRRLGAAEVEIVNDSELIAVWNSVMDEDRYLTRRWNEFITS